MIIHQFVPVSMSQTSKLGVGEMKSQLLASQSRVQDLNNQVSLKPQELQLRPDENEEHSIYAHKRLRKANNEDHCLVHHLRFGMRNRLKKRIPNRKPRNKLLNSFLVDSRVSNPQTKGISIFGNQQQGIRSMKFQVIRPSYY